MLPRRYWNEPHSRRAGSSVDATAGFAVGTTGGHEWCASDYARERRSVAFRSRDCANVAIERLLARLVVDKDPPWLLKGGYAMELRFRPKARTTSDIDL
jgi:hypothetical protein